MTAPLRREEAPLRSVAALQHGDGGNVFQVIGPSGASLKKLRDLFRFVLYIKSEKYDTLVSCKDVIERMTSPAGQTGRADTGGSMFRNVDIQFDFDPINTF
jgi:primosomal protein N' (replication factor Y)